METGDRGRAALAHGPAPGDRGGRRRLCPQPHAESGAPDLRPHRMSPERGRGHCARTPDPRNTALPWALPWPLSLWSHKPGHDCWTVVAAGIYGTWSAAADAGRDLSRSVALGTGFTLNLAAATAMWTQVLSRSRRPGLRFISGLCRTSIAHYFLLQ